MWSESTSTQILQELPQSGLWSFNGLISSQHIDFELITAQKELEEIWSPYIEVATEYDKRIITKYWNKDADSVLVYISKNQLFLFHLIPSYYILFLLFWG